MSIDPSDNVVWTREVQLLTGVISGRQAVYPHVHTSRHTVLRHSSQTPTFGHVTKASNSSLFTARSTKAALSPAPRTSDTQMMIIIKMQHSRRIKISSFVAASL